MSAYFDFGCAGLKGGVESLPGANTAALGVELVLEKVGVLRGEKRGCGREGVGGRQFHSSDYTCTTSSPGAASLHHSVGEMAEW